MAEKPDRFGLYTATFVGYPAEYCEFGPNFEKCKPWLINNAPDLLKDAGDVDADKQSDHPQSTSVSHAASSKPKEEVKRLLGGVKLNDASKKLGRKHATGAVFKVELVIAACGASSGISKLQLKVPESALFFIEDGKKVPAA
ncbi:UNVERIFIED_CONTAM: hypothetical protein Scaly_1685500 [Sesamum calycinum]|uniref:DENR N-terminal domain-containing protein n=1 Tax=Sesamum calycinum TaxID=2727403 RepID=A0AAW2NS42_9LAMI